MKVFLKQHQYLDFIVAILCLITYFVRSDSDNTIWLILFFAWLSFGFTAMTRRKIMNKDEENN